MNDKRYVLDVLNPSTEDIEWLDRTMKNIAALINVNHTRIGYTRAMLCIAPLKEEDKDEYKNQDN